MHAWFVSTEVCVCTQKRKLFYHLHACSLCMSVCVFEYLLFMNLFCGLFIYVFIYPCACLRHILMSCFAHACSHWSQTNSTQLLFVGLQLPSTRPRDPVMTRRLHPEHHSPQTGAGGVKVGWREMRKQGSKTPNCPLSEGQRLFSICLTPLPLHSCLCVCVRARACVDVCLCVF